MILLQENPIKAVRVEPEHTIAKVADLLDLMMTVAYQYEASNLILSKQTLEDDFFKLRTGIAGEMLQKFSNYKMKVAIVGDFSGYTSKSLRDFIYECNQGNHLFFNTTVEDAWVALGGKPSVTCAEMREIEQKADRRGLSYLQMMENAGAESARWIEDHHSDLLSDVAIFCGKGNNGGDGFVVARHLQEAGAKVELLLVDGGPKTEEARRNLERCMDLKVPVQRTDQPFRKTPKLIVDAIYGTGFYGDLNQRMITLFQSIANKEIPIVALDIPSGRSGDIGDAGETGEINSSPLKADATLAFHRFKPAHLDEKAGLLCGDLICLDIGI